MARPLDIIFSRMKAAGEKTALLEAGGATSYADLVRRVDAEGARFAAAGIGLGTSVLLRADFGLPGIAALLALLRLDAIVTPVAPSSFTKAGVFAEVAHAGFEVDAFAGTVAAGPGASDAPFFESLRAAGRGGLVIFTSGTTGVAKGALHDADRLLAKFVAPGKDLVTLAFLLFDHIAGIDTLFYCLSNASILVCLPDRSPETVARVLEEARVEVLPTAPSFLNLLLLSGAADGRDFSALKIITYGAETMPEALLSRLAARFPGVRLVQKYGTSELGALRSRSEATPSLWISLGEEGTDWRLCAQGLLEVKSRTTMLGYLNAPQPFTRDGWYCTGDRVERRADGMIRVLGRDSDMINVGGQKVFPAEVENALTGIDGVAEAAVYGAPHPILGSVVCARVRMQRDDLQPAAVRAFLRRTLAEILEPYKVPQKIEVTGEFLTTPRFKQQRSAGAGSRTKDTP